MRLMMTMMCLPLLLLAGDDDPGPGDRVTIAVQNQFIYPMPAFYASPAVPVEYGTVALVEEVNGEWLRITAGSAAGWIHRTAVTGAIESAGSGGASASGEVASDEIMLAGRGFNRDLEEAYSGKHPELNYSAVDMMENSWNVSPEKLYEFLVRGNLADAGAASGNTSPGGERGGR